MLLPLLPKTVLMKHTPTTTTATTKTGIFFSILFLSFYQMKWNEEEIITNKQKKNKNPNGINIYLTVVSIFFRFFISLSHYLTISVFVCMFVLQYWLVGVCYISCVRFYTTNNNLQQHTYKNSIFSSFSSKNSGNFFSLLLSIFLMCI